MIDMGLPGGHHDPHILLTGEDYLYPQSYFVFVQLPIEAQQALAAT
jgi:hypothetical protein